MSGWWSSFRARLTLAGFAAIYVTVLALFAVTYLTEDESVRTVDGVEVATRSSHHGFGWVELAVVLLAPVAVALAWWWAGRAVRPIERIRTVAEQIEGTDLSARIDLQTGPTEMVALAGSFDAMLDRLHAAAERQRRVLDEISHELRTPLAVLLTNADVRLGHPAPTIDLFRDGLAQSRRTADRMRVVLDRLMVDARSRAGTIDRHPADLMEVVRGLAEELAVVGATRDVRVHVEGPASLVGSWDAAMLGRAIANLVDNAIRVAPGGSTVEVAVADESDRVVIAVSDAGPGIPDDALATLFDRPSQSRQDGAPRTGLGLPIARQVAQAHGGELLVESPGRGAHATTFLLVVAT